MLVFLAVVALGVAGLVAVGSLDQRALAFTLGVQPQQEAAAVAGDGAELCQGPIGVSTPFNAVALEASTSGDAPAPVLFTIRAAPGGQVLRSTTLPSGYLAGATDRVRVARVDEGGGIVVCLRSLGNEHLKVAGDEALANRTSELTVAGEQLDKDMTLVFLRDRPRSVLSLVPAIFERASLFHPGWLGVWAFWALTALVVAVVPALLARALAEAEPHGRSRTTTS